MREKWVRRIAFLTGLLVLLLSATFAFIQNPGTTPGTTGNMEQTSASEPQPSHMPDRELVEAGQKVYDQASCSGCHAIAGEGNPRNLLDNVGEKYTAEELRNWIIGADALRGALSDRILKSKQKYRAMPEDDLKALIIYLQTI